MSLTKEEPIAGRPRGRPRKAAEPQATADARALGTSTNKPFSVLQTIAAARRPMSVSELAVLMEVPKPTMHRIVRQLDNEGLLHREPGARLYGLGPQLLGFALDALRSSMRTAPRHAVLQSLSAAVGETCNFGMMVENSVAYLDRVEAAWPFGLRFEPGFRVPLHCTSMGKLLLSHLARRKRNELIDVLSLDRYTENTITDRDALRHELDIVRKRGYSIDNQEFLAGVVCLAVPIRDGHGTVCAAIAISAPNARMSVEEAVGHLPSLHKAAAQLAAQLNQENDD